MQQPPVGAMAGIMPPGRLDTTVNMADNWKVWKQMWTNDMVITKLDSQTPEYKVALFLHCIGVDALKIFNGFQFDRPEDKNDMTKIIEKFDQFTTGELNETFERYTFNSKNQENKSIEVYVTALRALAKTCNFCDCMHDSIIRDRIVLGIQDKQTRKRLLQERKLTLKTCIDMCKSSEATNAQLKTISATDISHRNVPILTGQRKAASGNWKPSCAKHASFVAKHIVLRKANAQRGEQSVLSVVAETISQRSAQHPLEKCTASGMNRLMTATWNSLQALLYNWKRYTPSRNQIIPKRFTPKWSWTGNT